MSDPHDASAPAPAYEPLPAARRIEVLDMLRGFALFGIFIMNMPTFAHSIFTPPAQGGGLDGSVVALRELLFAGKFNLMFGMVFGIGFTLQLRRLEAADPVRATFVYLRRLAVLLAIGLVHAAFLWMGDVLVAYAVLGFMLLAIRRVPDTTLLALLGLCLVYPAAADVLSTRLFSNETTMLATFEFYQFAGSNDVAFGEGSFFDAVRETMRVFAWAYASPMGLFTVAGFFVQMATGILLGFYVGRRGWIERLAKLGPQVRRAQWAALAIALATGGLWWAAGGATIPEGAENFAAALARTIGRASLMCFYALTLVRLASAPASAPLLRVFAYAGRMPLSNYLLQTLMALFVFYRWGLGYWGKTSPLAEMLLAVALYFAIQLPLSAWWLSHFRFGPVEHVWRRLTYGRLPH
ncbi:MAG TPA: DUF418 domain-containing protein [Caldimonas sp.]|nr:DUF418 domain-containing protein [Caldimonas sp.]